MIIDKVIDKNPGDECGSRPLHRAVTTGNLAVFKLIFDSIEDKNPPNHYGVTPSHLAANCDNLEIFQCIFDSVEDKNPSDNNFGFTPLHFAAKCGYLSECQLIIFSFCYKNYFFSDIPQSVLSLGSNLNGSNIKEGDDVYFECSVRANPKPYKISWRFNVSTLY